VTRYWSEGGGVVPARRPGRVLLLVTTQSYRAGAFVEAAQRLGAPQTVGSERPQALAGFNPDGHLTLDFSAPEVAVEVIRRFAARRPLAAILAADDEGVLTAALAARALGLAHHPPEAVATARDKYRMRRALAAAGIPTPRFHRFPLDADPLALAREVEFPCVLKPLGLAASRGVIRADDPEQFAAAFRRVAALLGRPEVARPGDELARHLLVESYLPGAEVAVEGLVTGGVPRVLAVFDKPDPLEGPFFEETIYVTPSRLPAAARAAVEGRAAAGVAALGLSDGPVHAELRHHAGEAHLLEIAPRSIGGLCSRALRFGEGRSLEEVILGAALGLESGGLERERAAAGVMMIPIPRAGTLAGVRGVEAARAVAGIEDVRITIPVGDELVPLPEGARYLGFIFARGGAPEQAEAALREAHRWLEFDIQPGPGAAPGVRADAGAERRW